VKAASRTRVALALVPFTALTFGACGSGKDPADSPQGCPTGPVQVTAPNSLASASVTGACEGATTLVNWSNGAAGSACTDARQCAPTCCYCPTEGRSALTSWCDHGRCATANDVCCAVAGTPLKSCG